MKRELNKNPTVFQLTKFHIRISQLLMLLRIMR